MNWDQVLADLADRSAEALIRASAEALREMVWPAVGRDLGGGQLVPVETVRESDFARILDTAGGIDAWQHFKSSRKEWIRGIASRVQFYGPKDWRTHTVRYRLPSGNETELHKRLRYHSGHGVVGPHLTLHAYVDQHARRLLSVGVCRTTDLMDAVMAHKLADRWDWPKRLPGQRPPGPVYIDVNGQDDNEFLCVQWWYLKRYEHFSIWPREHVLNRATLPGLEIVA